MNKKKLKKICYNSSFTRSDYIYKLIDSGILNEQISKIKYAKIQTSMYQTFPNGKTDTYSLFLLNLDKFLMFLDFNFIINTTEKFVILQNILNNKNANIFLSTEDINDKRNWYIINYKKLIIENFYDTLINLYNTNKQVKKNLDKIININFFTLEKDDDINKIFDFLKDLINCSRENIRYLFFNYETLTNNEIYLNMYFEIFDTYKQRKKYLKLLGL